MMLSLLPKNTSVERAVLRSPKAPRSWTVYDLKGAAVARFEASEIGRDAGWNQTRSLLPRGVYWLKPNTSAAAHQVVNGI